MKKDPVIFMLASRAAMKITGSFIFALENVAI